MQEQRYSEIGSEFWIENVSGKLLTERDGVYAISGRTAIDLILQDILLRRSVKSVAMPAWCCDSMVSPFLAHGIEVKFYEGFKFQDSGFRLRILATCGTSDQGRAEELENCHTDIFYLTNYFGYENTLPLETVKAVREKGSVILYDRTHSFLMEDEEYQEIADYHFASIRKWMGVVGGAVVNGLSEEPTLKECPYAFIKEAAMKEKFQDLQGDTSVVKGKFLKAFGKFGHHLVEDYKDYEMDDLSYALYKQEDLKAMAKRRRENAAYLHKHLKGVKFLGELTDGAVPLFVPVFFESKEQRDDIRKKLIEKNIYCPVPWPKPQQIPAGFAVNEIYDTELSLICDQRYGIEDMKGITKIIGSTGFSVS